MEKILNYLYDTNVVVWATNSPEKFGPESTDILRKYGNKVSAVSILEITIKTMLGRLHYVHDAASIQEVLGVSLIDITPVHAESIDIFPELINHDPFDRLLLTQAKLEGLTLLTSDQKLLALNLPYVLDSRL